MPRTSKLAATLTLFSYLSLLPLLGGGWQTWRSASRDAVLDVASQPDVDHRILIVGGPRSRVAVGADEPAEPEKITIDGETPVRIHTIDGIQRPVPSRYLHSYGVHLEVESPSGPPVRVDTLGADFRVPDHKATLGLVLWIAIPEAVLIPLIILASAYHPTNGSLACPPSTPNCWSGF